MSYWLKTRAIYCSHWTSAFSHRQKIWRQIITRWKLVSPKKKAVDKKEFLPLFKRLIEALQVRAKENIISGFKKCGICPFNPQEVLTRLPNYIEDENEARNEDIQFSDNLLNFLRENIRRPSESSRGRGRGRGRRIPLQPRFSINIGDLGEDPDDAFSFMERPVASLGRGRPRRPTGARWAAGDASAGGVNTSKKTIKISMRLNLYTKWKDSARVTFKFIFIFFVTVSLKGL